MSGVRLAAISAAPLDVGQHLVAVSDARAGAVASFLGTVREHDAEADAAVTALEYTAHPDAEATLREIAADAIGDAEALVAVSHRVGTLAVGEIAVVVAVATPHRAEAFAICRAIVEELKHRLPVWKRQFTADGTSTWLGLGG